MSNATTSSGVSGETEPMEIPATVTASNPPPPASSPKSCANVPVSIEQKVFGGKIQTTYECSRCHTVSIHTESFTDLLLPFPDSKPDQPMTSSEASEPSAKKDLTMQVCRNSYFHHLLTHNLTFKSSLTST